MKDRQKCLPTKVSQSTIAYGAPYRIFRDPPIGGPIFGVGPSVVPSAVMSDMDDGSKSKSNALIVRCLLLTPCLSAGARYSAVRGWALLDDGSRVRIWMDIDNGTLSDNWVCQTNSSIHDPVVDVFACSRHLSTPPPLSPYKLPSPSCCQLVPCILCLCLSPLRYANPALRTYVVHTHACSR